MLDQIKLGMACHHGKLCSGDARATIIVRMNTDAPRHLLKVFQVRLFEKCQAVQITLSSADTCKAKSLAFRTTPTWGIVAIY